MPTIYFGYGSNLWLHQMRTRCPSSQYLGVARLPSYRWIINDRGYANVVEVKEENNDSNDDASTPKKEYSDVVYGLVFSLTPPDEARLDRNEGVPIAYTKEHLPCAFWPTSSSDPPAPVDVTLPPSSTIPMLVYIDRERVVPDTPREEYVYRMNRGIEDALRMGVPEGYVREVMRGFIPADEDDEGEEDVEKGRVAEVARAQAMEFKDESGVMGGKLN